jgi:tRNA(Glu) U13 pseudouridine synthase TruD
MFYNSERRHSYWDYIFPNEFEKSNGLKKMERKTFFVAKKIRIKETTDADFTWISFTLPKGCYATIYLKFLKEQLD